MNSEESVLPISLQAAITIPLDRPRDRNRHEIAVRIGLRRFLKNRLSFEVVAFLQAGLLAFNPVGCFLNDCV